MDLLKFLCRSQVRRQILFQLKNGPKTLKELGKNVSAKKEVLARELKKMEGMGLTYKERCWSLTEKGYLIAEEFFKFGMLLDILNKDEEFWNGAAIDKIPEEFRLKLWKIKDYEVLRIHPGDIDVIERKYERELLKPEVKWIKGVSPVYHPNWPKLYVKLARHGKIISLVLTEDVLRHVIEEYGEKIAEEFFECCRNCKVFICREIVGLSFTVTNRFLTLALFGRDGRYRGNQVLWSYEKSAVEWALGLFDYYVQVSEQLRY